MESGGTPLNPAPEAKTFPTDKQQDIFWQKNPSTIGGVYLTLTQSAFD